MILSDSIPVKNLSRKPVDVDAALAQHDQPMVALQHGAIGPRDQRAGMARTKGFNEVSGRQRSKSFELNLAQGRFRMQKAERWLRHGFLKSTSPADAVTCGGPPTFY